MSEWTFVIPLPPGPPSGKNDHTGWQSQRRRNRVTRDFCSLVARSERTKQDAPVATGRRSVHLTLLRGPRQRLLDVDNAYAAAGPVLDALKLSTPSRPWGSGWIVDDSPRWVDFTADQEIDRKAGPAVRIVVREEC